MNKTFSISVTLQRTIVESAHVPVPLTSDLFKEEPGQKGSPKLDPDRLWQAAIELGKLPTTAWRQDFEPAITIHPIQSPPELAKG